jgi:V/A-type H+-transporting ATPase subunit I
MMRPRPARWFEILVAREDTTLLLEALAATGSVELEARAASGLPAELSDLATGLGEYAALEARYGTWWPRARTAASHFPEPPNETLARGLAILRDWATLAEPHVTALAVLAQARASAVAWLAVLAVLRDDASALTPAALASSQPPSACAVAIAGIGQAAGWTEHVVMRTLPAPPNTAAALLFGDAAALARVRAGVLAAHGQWWPAPSWLAADLDTSIAAGHAELARIDAAVGEHESAIAAAVAAQGLAGVLSDLARLRWLVGAVHGLATDGLFARVSGWTSLGDGHALERAIEASGARALLAFPPAPAGLSPPLLLANPAWARPFELFARAFGVPGRDEADPTPVLAVVVPLMFGYMFGDVGQGAVLLAVGAWLRRRHAIARLLMWGGAASIGFGFAFGSVFTREDVLPALWLHPLAQPVTVLLVPVVAGAVLLAIGLALAALGAWWRHAFARWLAHEAGAALCWLGLLAALADPRALWLAAAGALAMAVGHAVTARRPAAALAGLGACLERSLQLSVNTLSFARVGAFALAHAGLGSAVSSLTDASPNPLVAGLVLLAGNVLILLLEALVVSIQATRLVLFEFFTRFLGTAGRVFVPLPAPPSRPLEV